MEDDGIKSALELAMERISALPRLTPQEIAEQKERENAPIGSGIAVKYINGALPAADLPVELSRYEGERQQIIRRALLQNLCREMRFGNTLQEAKKALRGILAVAPQTGQSCEEAANVFQRLVEEFEEAKAAALGKFTVLAGQKMKDLGIGGSAVRPNLNEDDGWKQELAAMQQAWEPGLEGIRRKLLEKAL